MIGKEREAEILRLYHAENWRVGTIAHQLGVHHSTVRRVLTQAGAIAAAPTPRGSIADPFVPFIRETLDKYPSLTARRLYEMVRQRGYPGGADHFRTIVARLRPKKPAEAYLRLRTFAAEQAQVDWGHFGKMSIGRALRPLMGFVMVLSYSRMTFLRFYLDAKMPNFIRGHVEAFTYLDGVPRVILYDNLKSAVLERDGDAIRFHPKLLELKAHYHFDPRPVAPARGNQKGRVERKIRDIRQSFFAARSYTSLDDLNEQALEWCSNYAAARPCPEDVTRTVQQVFDEERPKLLPLPDEPFETNERVEVVVRKTPYARFDLNDYSVPHDRNNRTLVVLADLEHVRIQDGKDIIAIHERSFDKGAQVEKPEHIEGLREAKRGARRGSILDLLHRAAPNVAALMRAAAERQQNLGYLTLQLRGLLERFGAAALDSAIAQALTEGTPHLGAIRQLLDLQRQRRGQPPPIAVQLPDDPRLREIVVRPHDLDNYDRISEDNDEEDSND